MLFHNLGQTLNLVSVFFIMFYKRSFLIKDNTNKNAEHITTEGPAAVS